MKKAFQNELKSVDKHVELISKSSLPTEDSLIIMDNQLLHRVFSILLNNAIKFTDKGVIEFGYTVDKENRLLFYVKDTGIGINPELNEIIFDRFRQVDESFTREHGGLGLGLSICKGLIKLMNGHIWVESDGKTGSVFYFRAAYCKETSLQAEIAIEDLPLHIENKQVLIVEDDPASYEYLNEILVSSGCRVLHATNGKNAMDIYANNSSIDLILLDIQLPEMDGYQFAKKIREQNTTIPIIAQTAHALSEDKKKCIDAGCSSYLTKPIHYDLLLDTLREYLC